MNPWTLVQSGIETAQVELSGHELDLILSAMRGTPHYNRTPETMRLTRELAVMRIPGRDSPMKTRGQSHFVRRLRTQDRSAAAEMFGASKVGQVRYSKTFRTAALAQREADAWNSTGDWAAEILAGSSPRGIVGYEANGTVVKERRA